MFVISAYSKTVPTKTASSDQALPNSNATNVITTAPHPERNKCHLLFVRLSVGTQDLSQVPTALSPPFRGTPSICSERGRSEGKHRRKGPTLDGSLDCSHSLRRSHCR